MTDEALWSTLVADIVAAHGSLDAGETTPGSPLPPTWKIPRWKTGAGPRRSTGKVCSWVRARLWL